MIRTGFKMLGVAIVAVVSAGVVAVTIDQNHEARENKKIVVTSSIEHAHSASWYVAHPDTLKQDGHRCAGDATAISSAVCQNVASAESTIGAAEMKSVAAENATSATNSSKSP